MNAVLHEFLIDVPRATAIWSVLLVLALTTLTVVAARPERDQPEPPPVDDLADLRRYAEEVAVAAAGAARTARRRRDAWLAAQEQSDRAWQAYDEAESAARRLSAAAALPAPRTPVEYAARKRWLHQAAVAAHWRGDLSARQLRDVFSQRDGWNPRLHPVEQEVALTRAVRDGKLAAYRAAVAGERAAWRDAEVAAEAARALSAEAYAAAVRLRPMRPAKPRAASARHPVAVTRWRPARLGLTLFR